jgi:hypothetical protein
VTLIRREIECCACGLENSEHCSNIRVQEEGRTKNVVPAVLPGELLCPFDSATKPVLESLMVIPLSRGPTVQIVGFEMKEKLGVETCWLHDCTMCCGSNRSRVPPSLPKLLTQFCLRSRRSHILGKFAVFSPQRYSSALQISRAVEEIHSTSAAILGPSHTLTTLATPLRTNLILLEAPTSPSRWSNIAPSPIASIE